jgi:DivIVA domain-containing protein
MPRLSPEDVANRAFATSFRGYAEAEVRSFLKRVAEELVVVRDREHELVAAIDDLESRLAAPRPLDEKELLDALGEETARLLRNAREAADDIREKSEERATRIAEEAQSDAQRMRHEAAEILAVRTREAESAVAELQQQAEARVGELRNGAERHFEEQRLRAQAEADAIVEAARTQGREMLEEAKALRERILGDLGRRRGLLQAQLEELRNGRDHLLEAYRVVKRTFLEATEALAQAEARAAAGKPLPSVEPSDVDAAIAAEEEAEAAALAPRDATVSETGTQATAQTAAVIEPGSEVPDPAAGTAGDPESPDAAAEPNGVAVATAVETAEPVATDTTHVAAVPGIAGADAGEATGGNGSRDAADPDGATALADVDSLFARIRAGAEQTPAEADVAAEVDAIIPDDGAAVEPLADDDAPVDAIAVELVDPRETWRRQASATIDPLVGPLVKQAKRAAQDEQNALLDALRRFRGRPSADQVLQSDRDAFAAWSAIVRSGLDAAYGGGRLAGGGDSIGASPDLVDESVRYLIVALRERLALAVDDSNDGYSTSLVIERIGARYREWKLQTLESMVEDVLAVAWSRGVFDASADGTLLQWVPAEEGSCADCDDNALEPTTKGEHFPTGQASPPAHPGCRCLLAPADALASS